MKSKFKAVKRYTDNGFDLIFRTQVRSDLLPHYLIPASPAAYEAQVEAMAKAAYKYQQSFIPKTYRGTWRELLAVYQENCRELQRTTLTAIGIKKPTKGNE